MERETGVSIWVALGILVVCFVVLSKCADWFVDGAVGIAEYLNIPKMLIGIVLVSLAPQPRSWQFLLCLLGADTRKWPWAMRWGR